MVRPARPARSFLVDVKGLRPDIPTTYALVWKEAGAIWWTLAGSVEHPMRPQETLNRDPVNPSTIAAEFATCGAHSYPCVGSREVSAWLGLHHRRIWRPSFRDGGIGGQEWFTPIDVGLDAALVSSISAANLLFEELEHVLAVIEPVRRQFPTFGHELRHLLIVACTEVESAWRACFEANAGQARDRFTTNDYVRLAAPMRLREWTMRLSRSSEQLDFTPFAGWPAQDPTIALPWYNAYNSTKHGRERHLDDAQLEHVLNAMAALQIMLYAQFGETFVRALHPRLFTTVRRPDWDPGECYLVSPFDDGPWRNEALF